MLGMARLRTVRSITVIMHGSARTARPIQALRGALWVLISRRRTMPRQIDMVVRQRLLEPSAALLIAWLTQRSQPALSVSGGCSRFSAGCCLEKGRPGGALHFREYWQRGTA